MPIRMTEEDRKEFNRMMAHKCAEFKSELKDGVMFILTDHDVRRKLAKERTKYFNFLSRKHQKQKAKFTAMAEAAKTATGGAPMGLNSAANIAISAAELAGTTAMNGFEERRQEKEVLQEYHTAEFLHFMSSQDYDVISERVAEIQTKRYRPLIFRLASGENGYFKLVKFFLKSMNTFAVENLKEHKGNEIKALIDACVPPASDFISYRDWPYVDFRNLRMSLKLGTRKTLELDPLAESLLSRYGPAVRALLGGHGAHVDLLTTQIVPYKTYTILGALNHAPILTAKDLTVISGLKENKREFEGVSGTRKYPMILLGHNENTSDLGVSFATTLEETLSDDSVTALRRLFPDYIYYTANYHNDSEEKCEDEETKDEDIRYPDEREECPWTRSRDARWHLRTQAIFKAMHGASEEEEEVVTKENYSQFKAMQAASNSFDANEAREAVVKMIENVQRNEREMLGLALRAKDRAKKQLEVVATVKNAAHAVKDLMACANTYGPSQDDYFTLTETLLESSISSLNTIRDEPLKESRIHQHALAASHAISTHAKVAFSLHMFCQKNFQLLLDRLGQDAAFNQRGSLYHNEKEQQQAEVLKLRFKIQFYLEQATEAQKIAEAYALVFEFSSAVDIETYLEQGFTEQSERSLTPQSSLKSQVKHRKEELYDTIDNIFELLNEEEVDDITLASIIDLCEQDVELNHKIICEAYTHENCKFDSASGADEQEAGTILSRANMVKAEASSAKAQKDSIPENAGFMERHHWFGYSTRARLLEYKNAALIARKRSLDLVGTITLGSDVSSPKSNHEANDFYRRVRMQANVTSIRQNISKLMQEQSDKPRSLASNQQLQIALEVLNSKVQQLNRSTKKLNGHYAAVTYEKLLRRVKAVKHHTNLGEALIYTRKIRLATEFIQRQITEDINLIYLLERKAAVEVSEIEDAKDSINALKDSLTSLSTSHFRPSPNHESKTQAVDILDDSNISVASITLSSTSERINALLDKLKSDQLLPTSEDEIEQSMYAFFENLKHTPYLINLKREQLKEKMKDILTEISDRMPSDSDDSESLWEVEFLTMMNLWLVDKVQKNEVVYPEEQVDVADDDSLLLVDPKAIDEPRTEDKPQDKSYCSLGDISKIRISKKFTRDKSYQVLLNKAERMSHISDDNESDKASDKSSNDSNITLATEITNATEALERIRRIKARTTPALQRSIDEACKCFRYAHTAAYNTKKQLEENAERNMNPTIDSWTMPSSTAKWSAWLDPIEREWRNKRKLEQTMDKVLSDVTEKSPVRIILDMALRYSEESLEKQKHKIGELNKFERPLDAIAKQLFDLRALSQQGRDVNARKVKSLKERYDKLRALIHEKTEQEEATKEDIELFRNSALGQVKRIHFNEWKRKMYRPELQSQRLQALRAGREKLLAIEHKAEEKQPDKPAQEKHEHVDDRHEKALSSYKANLKSEAAKLTIEDFEAKLESLQSSLRELTEPFTTTRSILKSHSFYGDDVNDSPLSQIPTVPRNRTKDSATLNY